MYEWTLEDRNIVRKYYKTFDKKIFVIHPRRFDDDFSLMKYLTPIEKNVYEYIVYYSLPLYPQYPVGNYFIDFADPVRKIGVEVDGRAWHKDREKDDTRQKELESLGWKILRIRGFETYKDDSINEWWGIKKSYEQNYRDVREETMRKKVDMDIQKLDQK